MASRVWVARSRRGVERGNIRGVCHANLRRCVMTRMTRRIWIAPGVAAALALSCGTGDAADQSKVNHATQRVERGAKQIGRGNVGPGFREFFVGIGHTIVEGAKFSGQNIKEFFTSRK